MLMGKNKLLQPWFISLCFLFALLLTIVSFAQNNDDSQIISIIPKPAKVQIEKGKFTFSEKTKIWISEPTDELKRLGDLIATNVDQSTEWKLFATAKMTRDIPKSLVLLQIKKDYQCLVTTEQPNEGYSLEIAPNKITITAGSGAGIFYAIQSLFQLMPVDANTNNISVPCVNIEDAPRFKWRGVLLDVSRHMFPVKFIKKFIDILAMYKMNIFHWHLTDDQGWRIEIKKYPKLTQVGAWRKETVGDGKPYGGFYTQDQIREIVAYAKERYITVVPEIEMPGHSLAALAAYPELSCTGGPFEVATNWGPHKDIFCAGNEKTFQFLENVLTEVMDLFPSKYIHIGGDEVQKDRWRKCPKCQARIKTEGLRGEAELQSYFIQRIEKFLNSKGRRIIGWDEILEGGLAQNATVESWRGTDGGIAAVKAKHNVIMAPGEYCYFDHPQGLSGEPKANGSYLSLEKVYSYEPVPDALNKEEAKFIIGAEATMWSEFLETTNHVEYMLLPRLCAFSEVVWTSKELKNYDDFSKRMVKSYDMLQKKNINFRVPPRISGNAELLITNNQSVVLSPSIYGTTVHYTLDGTEPSLSSPQYKQSPGVNEPILFKTKTFLENGKCSPTSTIMISFVDSTINGLNYKYYEGNWNTLPDFKLLTPTRTGKVYKLSLHDIQTKTDYFGIVWDGFIKINKDGEYKFYLTSDDGSKLFINNTELINNDGPHSTKEMNNKINLVAGKYPIRILYFQVTGEKNIKLEYVGPGITREPIPASAFYLK